MADELNETNYGVSAEPDRFPLLDCSLTAPYIQQLWLAHLYQLPFFACLRTRRQEDHIVKKGCLHMAMVPFPQDDLVLDRSAAESSGQAGCDAGPAAQQEVGCPPQQQSPQPQPWCRRCTAGTFPVAPNAVQKPPRTIAANFRSSYKCSWYWYCNVCYTYPRSTLLRAPK